MSPDLFIALAAAGLGLWAALLFRQGWERRAVLRALATATGPSPREEAAPRDEALREGAALPMKAEGFTNRRLLRAGFTTQRAPWVLRALRLAAAGIAAVLFARLWRLVAAPDGGWPTQEAQAIMAAAPIAVCGAIALLPDVLLWWLGSRRREVVRRELPFFLDQVVMLHKAGIGFDEAVQRASQRRQAALHGEFLMFLQEVRYGLPRVRAWKNMASRIDVEEVHALSGTMIQSEQVGVGLSEALEAQASAARERRFEQALEQAHKLPVQLVFPLVICFFPSLFVVTLAPALLRFFDLFGIVGER